MANDPIAICYIPVELAKKLATTLHLMPILQLLFCVLEHDADNTRINLLKKQCGTCFADFKTPWTLCNHILLGQCSQSATKIQDAKICVCGTGFGPDAKVDDNDEDGHQYLGLAKRQQKCRAYKEIMELFRKAH